MEELDIDMSSVLDDPDLYVLVFRHEVEATFTVAELHDLLRGARQLERAERERQKKAPKQGLGAAFSRALSGPSAEVEVLVLKLQAVLERGAERQGYKPLRDVLRRFLRPDDE